MVNITHKPYTLRKAVASAIVRTSKVETIQAVLENNVPKGNVFEFARAAGLLAIKKTSDLIPDCHPLPIEYAAVRYDTDGLDICIEVEVHTIYKTGVEVEAMHGAMHVALTIYDMLKPIDKELVITTVKLNSKEGGKSSFSETVKDGFKCAVIVCSDRVAAGTRTDSSGKRIIEKLEKLGIDTSTYEIIPDEKSLIRDKALHLYEEGYDLLLYTGGTGLSPRDVTPDALRPLLDVEAPGIMEAARNYGQQRTPMAMFSRGLAGFKGKMLIITLPGSPKGVEETMDAMFPTILHAFKIREGFGH
ncbi:bifunctional molybdenum cofactor biosynthesis protein MoaC/MoaB [Parapedobacter tibetensis]|uniref:bifunctional molybdenum cofactor biosynthesis protein MoaC/MoaB n=1 Tax=Parapedobacter tibetensis TaxID=2972951 RepID=UPI00214DED52|nr:bifunctional molybdenum cofactor biosynthesis protein MoaC/MoaB [Parapedobacter tibetensis]